MGCGATVTQLRRVAAGQFTIDRTYTLEQLTDMSESELHQALIKVDKPLEGFSFVMLSDEQARAINYGQSIPFDGSLIKEPILKTALVRMYQDETFLGLGEMGLDGRIAPKKLFNMTTIVD